MHAKRKEEEEEEGEEENKGKGNNFVIGVEKENVHEAMCSR